MNKNRSWYLVASQGDGSRIFLISKRENSIFIILLYYHLMDYSLVPASWSSSGNLALRLLNVGQALKVGLTYFGLWSLATLFYFWVWVPKFLVRNWFASKFSSRKRIIKYRVALPKKKKKKRYMFTFFSDTFRVPRFSLQIFICLFFRRNASHTTWKGPNHIFTKKQS